MADTSWRNRKTLILSRSEMIGLLEPEEYVRCVETAFRRMGEGRVYMEPKGHIVLDKYPGEWEIMPSYIEEPEGAPAAACKWVSIRFENRARFNLPTVFSILIYTEPEPAFPWPSWTAPTTRSCGPAHPARFPRAGWRERSLRFSRWSVPATCAPARSAPAWRRMIGRRFGSGAGPRRRWIRSWRPSGPITPIS